VNDPAPNPGEVRHALVDLETAALEGLAEADRSRQGSRDVDVPTRFILTDVSEAGLKERLLGSELALGLDIKSATQVDELLSRGTTHTVGVMGMEQTVTITWCTCADPGSHKLNGRK
jgi:hypothetical protein